MHRSIVLPESGGVLALCQALADPRRRAALAEAEPAGVGEALRLCRPPSLQRPLHPLLRRGAPLQRYEVDSYHSKGVAVEQAARLAEMHGLRPRAVAALEQAADELLLNALRCAQGAQANDSDHDRAAPRLPAEDRAVLRCGGDARRFVIAVRDRFGGLRRETVLAYLTRCAEAQRERRSPLQPPSPNAGAGQPGAGVGLYLVACSAWELLFRLRPGHLTEVVCAFPLRTPLGQGAPPLRALVFQEP